MILMYKVTSQSAHDPPPCFSRYFVIILTIPSSVLQTGKKYYQIHNSKSNYKNNYKTAVERHPPNNNYLRTQDAREKKNSLSRKLSLGVLFFFLIDIFLISFNRFTDPERETQSSRKLQAELYQFI